MREQMIRNILYQFHMPPPDERRALKQLWQEVAHAQSSRAPQVNAQPQISNAIEIIPQTLEWSQM
jgi:hypothetical protein